MKTNLLKNIFLVWSWIAIATSTVIFASQQGTSIQANLVNLVQYLGELHITSDGTPNGNSVLSVDGSGEFQQIRGTSQLVNTAGLGALGQTYPFVWAAASLGNIQVVAGVLADMVPILANQDASGSGMSSYIMAQWDRALLGFNADLTNQTDRVVELQVLDYGIVFRFPDGGYTFPLTAGTSGQVLTTDGSNELSWADAWSDGSSTNASGFDIVNTVDLFGQQIPFAGTVYQTWNQSYIAGVADLFGSPLAVLEYFDNGAPISYVAVSSWSVMIEALWNSITVYASGIRINDSYNLPNTDGTAGQILSTDGNGNLQWIDVVTP